MRVKSNQVLKVFSLQACFLHCSYHCANNLPISGPLLLILSKNNNMMQFNTVAIIQDLLALLLPL